MLLLLFQTAVLDYFLFAFNCDYPAYQLTGKAEHNNFSGIGMSQGRLQRN